MLARYHATYSAVDRVLVGVLVPGELVLALAAAPSVPFWCDVPVHTGS